VLELSTYIPLIAFSTSFNKDRDIGLVEVWLTLKVLTPVPCPEIEPLFI
jgi:hypothetical protein